MFKRVKCLLEKRTWIIYCMRHILWRFLHRQWWSHLEQCSLFRGLIFLCKFLFSCQQSVSSQTDGRHLDRVLNSKYRWFSVGVLCSAKLIDLRLRDLYSEEVSFYLRSPQMYCLFWRSIWLLKLLLRSEDSKHCIFCLAGILHGSTLEDEKVVLSILS